MPPVILAVGGSTLCEQAGMVTIRSISCDEACVWEGIRRTGMRGSLLAGGPHKLRTDSTVSHRWLAVLLEVTILLKSVPHQACELWLLWYTCRVQRQRGQTHAGPHLQAAATLAALAGEHSCLLRS